MNDSKFFNVKQAAKLLGLSPMTIRRRIQDGCLYAVLGSKREGYLISESDLLRYAEQNSNKVGSLWTSGGAVAGGLIGKNLFHNSVAGIAAGALLGGTIGHFLNDLINGDSFSSVHTDSENKNIADFNNPKVLQAIINRLNEEVDFYEMQIEHQKFLLDRADETDKPIEEEKLFQLQREKFRIRKEIKNLEISKARLDN